VSFSCTVLCRISSGRRIPFFVFKQEAAVWLSIHEPYCPTITGFEIFRDVAAYNAILYIVCLVPDFSFVGQIYCARERLRCVDLTVVALINAVPWDVLP